MWKLEKSLIQKKAKCQSVHFYKCQIAPKCKVPLFRQRYGAVCVWRSSGTLYLCLVHGGGGWDVNVFKCLFHHVSLFFTFYLFYTMLLLFVLLIICFAWTCACVILYFFFFSFSLSLSLPVSFVFVWFYMNLFSTVLICLTTDVLVG